MSEHRYETNSDSRHRVLFIPFVMLILMGAFTFAAFTGASQFDAAEKTMTSGFFLLMGLVLVWAGFVALKKAREISDTPTSKVRSAAVGFAEFVGRVEAIDGNSFPSYLDGRACVFSSVKVTRKQRSGKHTVDATVLFRHNWVPFFVVDDTGELVVEPNDNMELVGFTRELKGREKAEALNRLTGLGASTEGGAMEAVSRLVSGTGSYSVRVTDVPVGFAPLYALGTVVLNPYVDRAEGDSDTLMLAKSGDASFLLSANSEAKTLGGRSLNGRMLTGLGFLTVAWSLMMAVKMFLF